MGVEHAIQVADGHSRNSKGNEIALLSVGSVLAQLLLWSFLTCGVCVCVCVCACMCACMRVFVHVCVCVWVCVQLVVRGTVFARMSPDQKAQLVEVLQNIG